MLKTFGQWIQHRWNERKRSHNKSSDSPMKWITTSQTGPGPSDHPNQTVLAAIDFHSMGKKKLWKSMDTSNCLVTNILQSIILCFQQYSYTFWTILGWVNDRIVIFLVNYEHWSRQSHTFKSNKTSSKISIHRLFEINTVRFLLYTRFYIGQANAK